jgi:putative nucleotidyltransferase with HDIG domain
LPEVAQQVLATSSREDADARVLADLIRRDAAFAAHLLRVANSPAYAPRTPIVSLQQGISRLGLRTIREIAVLISCKTRAFQVKGYEEEVRLLFRHCLAAGLYAQEVARARRLNVEDAFLAGLLHDVGRPTAIQASVDLQAELGLPALSRQDMDRAVGEVHEEVGEAMLRAWGLSARLVSAVRHHHHPEKAGEAAGTATLIRLADDLAHHAVGLKCGPRSGKAGDVPSRPVEEDDLRRHPAAAALNVYPEVLDGLLARKDEILAQVEAIS